MENWLQRISSLPISWPWWSTWPNWLLPIPWFYSPSTITVIPFYVKWLPTQWERLVVLYSSTNGHTCYPRHQGLAACWGCQVPAADEGAYCLARKGLPVCCICQSGNMHEVHCIFITQKKSQLQSVYLQSYLRSKRSQSIYNLIYSQREADLQSHLQSEDQVYLQSHLQLKRSRSIYNLISVKEEQVYLQSRKQNITWHHK